ncbi:TonB-dependent receptor [Dasania sp. GY-MA-18]|uniref:TonB-dependent receptor n=1 Tax=Dasania phycosphaerae TaxID=2950436 RepID=A0A9J6RKJ9_9GAMM|nr:MULTISPECIES: TonB-dependent receptor [Dasania]MCR8922504.1 TonB-dependent receptor [Dasania sp. GY-MA-18]MCZ0864932.1 TonB-dependent receptor [Dasania phycosphaerae]MCZ0868660.1 TonB-dependent receptor [Dasania phycosphaerae]
MKTLLSLAVSAIASGAVVAAEQNHNKADDIIVTATRTQQSYAETLASVTVISREDIEKFQAQSVAELLAKAPGLSITSNGGRGASTGISLRGNQSDHTLFLIDGVRVGSATLGSTAVEYLDPELIERIEIVRGPKSSLYGSDALGGVINIITRQANANQPLLIKAAVGNHNTSEASASLGHKGENYQANLTASYVYTGGYDFTEDKTAPSDDDDAYRQRSLGFNGSYTPIDTLTLGLSYQFNEAESEYDTNCFGFSCSPYTDSKTESLNVSGSWQLHTAFNSSLSVGSSKDETETLYDEYGFSGGVFETEKTNIDWQNDIRVSDNALLTLGYDYLNEKVDGSTNYDEDERDNHAVYAQLQFVQGAVSANLGARNDDNEQFGSHDTFNASLGYDIAADLKVVASYGQAFKAPTFNDLYYPFFGNPTMVPEESESYELAFKGFADNYSWAVSAYQNDVENLIQYNSAIFANDQIATATIKGIDASFETELMGWTVNTALTLLDTQDDATGNELARRPEQVINIDIDRSFDQWSVGASIYGASSRYNDAANSSKLNGYGTVALRGAYTIDPEWKLQLKVDNLFEKDYVLARGFSSGNYLSSGLELLFSVVYTPEL